MKLEVVKGEKEGKCRDYLLLGFVWYRRKIEEKKMNDRIVKKKGNFS